MDEKEGLITAALEQYPLEAVPPGFSAKVMLQIQSDLRAARAQAYVRPPFRLEFSDIVVPLFTALFITLLFAGALALAVVVDPMRVERLQIEMMSYLNALPLLAVVVFGAACGLALLVLSAGILALLLSTSSGGLRYPKVRVNVR